MKKGSRPPIPLGPSLAVNPWFYFIGFAGLNLLLSYAPLSLKNQLWIFIFLFVPLFCLALGKGPSKLPGSGIEKKETLAPAPSWSVLTLLTLALGLRFFQLSSLSTWPIHDEGRTSVFALHQAAHWDWKLLYGYNQLPPLYYWIFGAYYKIFEPSLFTLWLFPALLSSAILIAGAAASRLFFSRSFAWLVGGLLAFSFWPLYAGRFAAEGLLVLFWEVMGFLWLGIFLKAAPGPRKPLWAAVLGIWVGCGFYVHLHWPVIAVAILTAAGFHLIQLEKKKKREGVVWAALALPLLLIPLPLLGAVWNSQFGSYISSLLAFGGPHLGWSYFLYNSFSYVTALVWGVNVDYFAYKPFWGGFLNPLLGSLFWLGWVQLIQHRESGLMKWTLFSFVIFFAPAFLTNDLETFRIIQILPLLLMVTGLGLQFLLVRLRARGRILFLVLLSALSLGLDLYHLLGPYAGFYTQAQDKWATYAKSVNFWRAYHWLKPIADQEGPGALLFDCEFEPEDQTLATAAYPFNASRNPALSLDSIRWAALFCHSEFSKQVAAQFPGSRFVPLYWGSTQLASSLMWQHQIGIQLIPVNAANRGQLKLFIQADRLLAQNAFEALNLPQSHSRSALIENLKTHLDEFKESPLLGYVLWKAIAEIFHQEENAAGELSALRSAVAFDPAEAYLWYRMASLLVKQHQYPPALKAFKRAGQLNPQLLPPPEIFKKIEGSIRGENSPASRR